MWNYRRYFSGVGSVNIDNIIPSVLKLHYISVPIVVLKLTMPYDV